MRKGTFFYSQNFKKYMIQKIFTTILMIGISTSAMSQLMIRGVVKDKQSSETLPGLQSSCNRQVRMP